MAKNKKSFEQAFQLLEKLVEEFESGRLPLDQAVKKFELGLALAHDLQTQLKETEQRVEIIKKHFSKLSNSSSVAEEE